MCLEQYLQVQISGSPIEIENRWPTRELLHEAHEVVQTEPDEELIK